MVMQLYSKDESPFRVLFLGQSGCSESVYAVVSSGSVEVAQDQRLRQSPNLKGNIVALVALC